MLEISKEYATALFSLAKESDSEQLYAETLSEISELFHNSPEYIDLLASPSIPIGERIHAIDMAFSSRAPEYIVSFLKVLLLLTFFQFLQFPKIYSYVKFFLLLLLFLKCFYFFHFLIYSQTMFILLLQILKVARI